MHIKKIDLINFRNYEKETIILNENVNIFYGNNAQGKTNILEALYFSALGRSFRTYKEEELIKINEETAKIKIEYVKNNRENEIEILLSKKEKKSIKMNQIKINKNSELIGNINIVIFSPDDIIILKQAPALRRKFLDILISQLKPQYLHELSEYKKILDERNAMLKSKNIETIDIWNESLAQKAERVHKYRKEYIEKIGDKLKKIYPELTQNKEEIKIQYKTKITTKENYIEQLKQNQSLDLYRGYTSEGIHRDDFEIYINEKELNLYGSQGQHRTTILALKLAEMQIIKEEIGENPVLLLDDVTSELDENRINSIFNSVKDYQVFITGTDVKEIIKHESLTKNLKLYNISNGKII